MGFDEKDARDQTQTSDSGAGDKGLADKLQDASRGPGASTMQAAQQLTGAKLVQDVMQWQQRITSLPSQVDPSGNVVAFNTQQWTDEHFEEAGELQKELPQRVNVYGVKQQLSNKELSQIKTLIDLEEPSVL